MLVFTDYDAGKREFVTLSAGTAFSGPALEPPAGPAKARAKIMASAIKAPKRGTARKAKLGK